MKLFVYKMIRNAVIIFINWSVSYTQVRLCCSAIQSVDCAPFKMKQPLSHSLFFMKCMCSVHVVCSCAGLCVCVHVSSEGKMVVLSLAIGLAEQDDFANLPDLQEAPASKENETTPEKR